MMTIFTTTTYGFISVKM